jgi:hypothetical protein
MFDPITEFEARDPDGQALLTRFPETWRGAAMNHFLTPIREGRAHGPARDHLLLLQTCLVQHRDEALRLAGWALAYEALPAAYKEARKAGRSQAYQRRFMASQEATEKQLQLLAKLGYIGPVESRLHASRLIDAFLAPRPADIPALRGEP